MQVELRAGVQYGDLHGTAAADWADSLSGAFGLLEELGLDSERYQVVALRFWSGEHDYGSRRVDVKLTIFAEDQASASSGVDVPRVVPFEVRMSPQRFLWIFKRLSIVFNEQHRHTVERVECAAPVEVAFRPRRNRHLS